MRKIAQHPAFGKNMLYSSCTPIQRAMAKEQINFFHNKQAAMGPSKSDYSRSPFPSGFSGEAIRA